MQTQPASHVRQMEQHSLLAPVLSLTLDLEMELIHSAYKQSIPVVIQDQRHHSHGQLTRQLQQSP